MRRWALFWVGVLMVWSSLVGVAACQLRAATMSLSDVAVGKIITINGMKFAKTSVSGEFVSICESNSCSSITHCIACSTREVNVCTQCDSGYALIEGACIQVGETTMQGWTGCNTLATPAPVGFTQGPTLIDARDGKSYEIRKFADGKCWMVDNLMYGGVIDNCAGVDAVGYTDITYGGADGMAAPSNRFGTGTYGNCRDPRVGAAIDSPCYNSTTCGYYYNWQAAMQHASAYDGIAYTGPTSNVEGICPQGWHLPKGTTGNEFTALDIANEGTSDDPYPCNTTSCNFWRPGYAYKGVYSGYVDSSGVLASQGSHLRQWSASDTKPLMSNTWNGMFLLARGSDVGNTYVDAKRNGYAVRCIKN